MPVLALTPTIDATIEQANPASNFGGLETLSVINATGAIKKRSVVVFDRSAIPVDATITVATFSVEVTTLAAGSATCTCGLIPINLDQAADVPIVEAEATWNERSVGNSWVAAGGDTEGGVANPTFSVPVGSLPQTITIDVLTIVNYALANYTATSPSQIGFLVRQSSGTNRTWVFASKENTSSKQVPTLTLTYSLPGSLGSRPGGRFRNGRPLPTSRPIRGNEE